MPGVELTVRLRNVIRLAKAVRRLAEQAAWLDGEVEAALRHMREREEEIIFRLALAVEYRDNDTGDHTWRVARYSQIVAEALGLPPEACRSLYLAAPLHDVGKVGIPDGILLKPGRLDPDEFALIKTHAAIGQRILGGSASELIRLAAEIAASHHERWDGSGYPEGLAGDEIPLAARIVAVADVFDALTTSRPYKEAMSVRGGARLSAGRQRPPFRSGLRGGLLRALAGDPGRRRPRPGPDPAGHRALGAGPDPAARDRRVPRAVGSARPRPARARGPGTGSAGAGRATGEAPARGRAGRRGRGARRPERRTRHANRRPQASPSSPRAGGPDG